MSQDAAAHFNGQKYEAEVKFRLRDAAAFLGNIKAAGAEPFHLDNLERDIYYEHPAESLASKSLSMSLRQMQPSGIQLWIVKGPGPSECEAVNVTDYAKFAGMLEKLGYTPWLEIVKTRSIWFLDSFHITVDKIDALGEFAEIAVMTDDINAVTRLTESIKQLGASLGLRQSDIERASYKTMMENHAADAARPGLSK